MITQPAVRFVYIGSAKHVGRGGQRQFNNVLDQAKDKGQAALIATVSEAVTKQMAQDRVTVSWPTVDILSCMTGMLM